MVKRILAHSGRAVDAVLGDHSFLQALSPADFTDDRFGVPTVTDILAELEKPGRDPRPEFKTATFKDGVDEITDLEPGMVLEGVVSNVTNFGAFVDVGVHHDGLVHVSQLADRFVEDPREVVKAGDVVTVRVVDIDVARQRIGLTMRLREPPARSVQQDGGATDGSARSKTQPRPDPEPPSALAAQLAKLKHLRG